MRDVTLLPFISTTTQRTKGGGEYQSLALQIDKSRTLEVQQYAQKHRITVNTIMQGVWSFLLHNYTGKSEVVYGVIVSGRPDDLAHVEQRVGMYINTLPLHSTLKEGEAIGEWLEGIQQGQVLRGSTSTHL